MESSSQANHQDLTKYSILASQAAVATLYWKIDSHTDLSTATDSAQRGWSFHAHGNSYRPQGIPYRIKHRIPAEEMNDSFETQDKAREVFSSDCLTLMHNSIDSKGIVQAEDSVNEVGLTKWSQATSDGICIGLVISLTKKYQQMMKNRDIQGLNVIPVSSQVFADIMAINNDSIFNRLGTLVVTNDLTSNDIGRHANQSGSAQDFEKRSQDLDSQRDAMQRLALDCKSTEFEEHKAAYKAAGCGVVTISQASLDRLSSWLMRS